MSWGFTAAALGGAFGGALLAVARADARRVREDPEHALLSRAVEGRPERVVSPDGTVLHAEVFGPDDAPTIVLVHGWTCALRFWKRQLLDLAHDHRVVAFDLRGHGRSEPAATGDWSTDALADDLEAVLRALVPEGERAVLAGHSLGGMTIMAWAGRHPDSVRERAGAAALVNTGTGDLVSEALVVRTPKRVHRLRRAVGGAVLAVPAPLPGRPSPISTRAVRHIALSRSASPAQVAFCERIVLECPRASRAGFGASLSRLDLAHAIERLAVPTVVIAAERDKLTPPVHSRRLAEALPECTGMIEIPRSGHMSPVEAPGVVTGALRDLARRLSVADPVAER